MKILMIGDIIGNPGVDFVVSHLGGVRKLKGIDFCIANGENTSPVGKGISREAAERLFLSGVDVITLGNHSFNKNDVKLLLEEYPVIRPSNYPPNTVGSGYIEKDGVAVINVCGRVYMDSFDCPFRSVKNIISKTDCKIKIVDFHGEATSEKRAFAEYFDGKVSAVLGTHTHVQTADERILPNKTAFISDVGMTGAVNSILGVKKDAVIDAFLTVQPRRFDVADGNILMNCVIVETDAAGSAVCIERLNIE